MKFRHSASSLLKPEALSEFLSNDVFKNGVFALGPCLFFTFETVACLIDQDNIEDSQCANTSMASFNLSGILSMLLVMSMIEKALPVRYRESTAWELSHVATLQLKWRQGIEGIFLLLSSISSLYLLSSLGVEGEQSSILTITGIIGILSALFALVIHVNVLSQAIGRAIESFSKVKAYAIEGKQKEVEKRFKETSATARLRRSESASTSGIFEDVQDVGIFEAA